MEQDVPYKEHHIKKELDAVYERQVPKGRKKTLHSIKIWRTNERDVIVWNNKWNSKSPNQSFWSSHYSWKSNDHFCKWKIYVSQLATIFSLNTHSVKTSTVFLVNIFTYSINFKCSGKENSNHQKSHISVRRWLRWKEEFIGFGFDTHTHTHTIWILGRTQMDLVLKGKSGWAPNVILWTLKSLLKIFTNLYEEKAKKLDCFLSKLRPSHHERAQGGGERGRERWCVWERV